MNRRLARAYESLDRTLRSSTSSHAAAAQQHTGGDGGIGAGAAPTALATPVDDHAAEGVPSSESDPRGSSTVSPGDAETIPPSPGSSVGSVPATEEWREVRLSGATANRAVGSGWDSTGGAKSSFERPRKGSGGAGGASQVENGLQVRNLSTGDVDIVVPGEEAGGSGGIAASRRPSGKAMARERASTEGEPGGTKVILSDGRARLSWFDWLGLVAFRAWCPGRDFGWGWGLWRSGSGVWRRSRWGWRIILRLGL